jgi:hypothetical protein
MIDQAGFEEFVKKVAALPPNVKKIIRDTISKRYGIDLESTATPKKGNYVIGEPKGLRERGNIDLDNRPTVENEDGTHSSEYSTSFGTDKGEVLVPTIVNGKFLTPSGKKPPEGSEVEQNMFQRAQEHYNQTGEHMGIFDTPENADTYANVVHNRGNKPAPPVKASPAAVELANQE